MCSICDPRSQYTDCICHPNFKNFTEVYKRMHVNDAYTSFNIIKKWDISTMTMCCCFNSLIETSKYTTEYIDENGKKPFYNCANVYITVKYQHKPKVSAKIFSNGNIQLAGILNPYSATYAFRKIFKRLKTLKAFKSDETAKISNVRICMINSDFKIDKFIKQTELCKIIDNRGLEYLKTYSFNPNKYPGVNIKMKEPDFDKVMSCIVFRPGSVIITGGNDITSYEKIYRCINDAFVRNDGILSCPT